MAGLIKKCIKIEKSVKKKAFLQKNTLSFRVKCVIIFTATFQRVFEGQTNTIFRRN